MTNRNRHSNNEFGDQQQSSQRPTGSPHTADDRGMTRERRSFSGDREYDELGSEMEDDLAVEDSDDRNMDDGLGGPDRNH